MFPGFPPEAMSFLADLKVNNDRTWFAARRVTFEQAIRAPADAFVAAIAPQLEALAGAPVSAKVFRVHRDVHFSKDKSPYNAHLHIAFVVRPDHGTASGCGFYFGLEPQRLHIGAGAFEFRGRALDGYRAAVADDRQGRAITDIVPSLERSGFRLGEPDLKRVPAPYAADHARAEFLRRKGLVAWRETTDRTLIEGPDLIIDCLAAYQSLTPLVRWVETAML